MPVVKMNYCRNIGVEIELNAFSEPIDKIEPDGIQYVANVVAKTLNEYVEIRAHEHTHWHTGNGCWVLKPDYSCGMEACSPVTSGWNGFESILRVVDAFALDNKIKADDRCSLHAHVGVEDLTLEQKANILRWWIKAEPVFFDSVPDLRKNNKYCAFIGLWDWVTEEVMPAEDLIDILGRTKYNSVNTFHLMSGLRDTIEFRIGEGTLCRNAFFTKNWLKLIIHFVEVAKDRMPTSMFWMDVNDVFKFLGFNSKLSSGMEQVRNWFLARLFENSSSGLSGLFGKGRDFSRKQISELLNTVPNFDPNEFLYPVSYTNALYNKIYST